MKILVVGGGGREHAIIKKLKESKKVEKIYAAPGNGGISLDAECFNISVMDIEGMIALAKEQKVNFVFVAEKMLRDIISAVTDTVKNPEDEPGKARKDVLGLGKDFKKMVTGK